ncbi:MAG: enoyl-CoA hydratase/isomerase family protein [Thermoplasmata archaeon]
MYIEIERREKAVFLFLSREGRMNAINMEMVEEMNTAIKEVEEDDEVRAIILQGKGKNFSAGADIDMLAGFDESRAMDFRKGMNDLTYRIRKCRIPVIAALKGYSLGGGMEIAESADIRIASSTAVLGQPESGIGINAGAGGNVMLPKLIGRGRSMYMALSGIKMSSEEALKIGLVDVIFDEKSFDDSLSKFIDDITKKPKATLHYIKSAINMSYEASMETAMEMESLYFSKLFNDEEVKKYLSRWRRNE